jgi:hypothetical protein
MEVKQIGNLTETQKEKIQTEEEFMTVAEFHQHLQKVW